MAGMAGMASARRLSVSRVALVVRAVSAVLRSRVLPVMVVSAVPVVRAIAVRRSVVPRAPTAVMAGRVALAGPPSWGLPVRAVQAVMPVPAVPVVRHLWRAVTAAMPAMAVAAVPVVMVAPGSGRATAATVVTPAVAVPVGLVPTVTWELCPVVMAVTAAMPAPRVLAARGCR